MNLNDLRLAAFVHYGNHTILYGGDLEEKGWELLLSKDYFIDWLKISDVFIASHHGRESGFSSKIFEYCKPKLTIIYDGRFSDTSATDRYVSVTSGMKIKNKDVSEYRKVITTRNDGHIFLQSNGTDLFVQLGWKPT
jgi:competence protein ComEC